MSNAAHPFQGQLGSRDPAPFMSITNTYTVGSLHSTSRLQGAINQSLTKVREVFAPVALQKISYPPASPAPCPNLAQPRPKPVRSTLPPPSAKHREIERESAGADWRRNFCGQDFFFFSLSLSIGHTTHRGVVDANRCTKPPDSPPLIGARDFFLAFISVPNRMNIYFISLLPAARKSG